MAAAALRRNARTLLLLLSRHHLSSLPPAHDAVTLAKSAARSEADPDRLVALFLSPAAASPAFRGDRPLFSLAVRRLARAHRPDLVHRLLDHHASAAPSASSEGFLIRILSLYSAAGMPDHAATVFFDRMPQQNCPRSERSLCALLAAFADNRRLDHLRDAFDRIPKELGIAPGVASYNVLLKALCENGDMDAAWKLLDEMPDRGVTPNIVSHNTLLNGYLKKGDEAGSDEVLKEINKKGLSPNVVTYNCRMSALCAKGWTFAAWELLDVMASKGVSPNRVTFNMLINGFCSEGDAVSALRVFKRMQETKSPDGAGVSPNFETYIALIQGLVQEGEFGPALEICKECLAKKWAPPFQSVKGLVDGLIENSRLDEAKDVISKMRKAVKGDAYDAWKKLEGAFAL